MINNKRNKKWFAAFAAIVLAIFAIQSLSRINFAQDPPEKKKQDKQANITKDKSDSASWKYPPPPPPPPPPSLSQDFTTDMPAPPPPPPPPPFPFFSGTNDFNKSNEAFGDYITKNIQLSSKLSEQKNSGVFVIVTFDNNGNVTNAEKGFTPKGFSTGYKIKFSDDPQILNEAIKVIKNAPKFNVEKFVEGSLFQVNYGIIFRDNGCKVMPVHFVYNDVIDSPAKKQLDPGQLNLK